MSYHDLSSCTLNAAERREEADRIVIMIKDKLEDMTPVESSFVERVDEGYPISVKQLFWLRDIKDKYL